MIRTVTATRYVTPLRQGGSLPALVEADDESLYVMKFAGAGQDRKALIAELIAGEIGRALGLRVPELVFITLEPSLGAGEGDPEIRALLAASVGLNLGLRFLPYAFEYNRLLRPRPGSVEASAIVWFDAYVTNVDRTPRNVNLLLQSRQLWLIDHGACLYFHHDWQGYLERSRTPFALIKDHALLPYAAALADADTALKPRLTPEVIEGIVALTPDVWLNDHAPFTDPAEHRRAYVTWLQQRLEASSIFVAEAQNARSKLV
ncbi:MAG: aminotransferase class I and II [Chloroflexi bacterium]|nr:aminotransferase class I and II [Chloroflexota bacterium]